MSEATDSPYTRYQTATQPSRIRVVLLALVLFAVVLYGGYVEHWKWTGINGHTATLWDWLHLLLLPMVVAILPIWMSRTNRVTSRHKRRGAIALGVFAALVLLGYAIPWAWTGFAGNTVWDWLKLIALPVAVALAPIYGELRRGWSRRHTLIAACLLLAFAVICLGGYIANWAWTGFHGNTVWDWLHLLLLPLLIPAIVVPALKPMAIAAVTPAGGEGAGRPAAGDATEDQVRALQTSNR